MSSPIPVSPPPSPTLISLQDFTPGQDSTRARTAEGPRQPEITITPALEDDVNDIPTSQQTTQGSQSNSQHVQLPGDDLRFPIKPSDCGDALGFRWPSRQKWLYLTIIFIVQVSMNLNTTLYSNGIEGICREYGLSPYVVRWGGAASFLISYAFGCELWAPWSEEFGRKPVLQTSLGLVNGFCLLVALAPNWATHVAGRTLGGLSSAGGSVTLACISDMFEPDDPNFQFATLFIVLSSVGGSIIGPIAGGFIETFLPWRWTVWIQLVVGVVAQLLHLFIVPETRTTIIMDRVAKSFRKSGKNPHIFGPNEIANKKRIDWVEFVHVWKRPFVMFVQEPIVLVFSLLSGFSDGLIFSKSSETSFCLPVSTSLYRPAHPLI